MCTLPHRSNRTKPCTQETSKKLSRILSAFCPSNCLFHFSVPISVTHSTVFHHHQSSSGRPARPDLHTGTRSSKATGAPPVGRPPEDTLSAARTHAPSRRCPEISASCSPGSRSAVSRRTDRPPGSRWCRAECPRSPSICGDWMKGGGRVNCRLVSVVIIVNIGADKAVFLIQLTN